MRPVSILVAILCCSGASLAAELLSEAALEKTTARGREDTAVEVLQAGSTVNLLFQSQSHISQTIQPRSQTNLGGGALTNAAGRNQIANGLNLR